MQMSIDFECARAKGARAGERCLDKTRREVDPLFAQKAEKAILMHLRVVGRASGEDLTIIARSMGAVPHDDRCFGPVYASLARRNLIRQVDSCPRARGHGTAGGRVWALTGGDT